MAEDLLGQIQSGREQHRRPVDGMEAQDVLTDHMDLGRPAPPGQLP